MNPFLDRILTNPLSFIQSNKIEPVDELDNEKLIVLSNNKKNKKMSDDSSSNKMQKLNNNSGKKSDQKEKKKPKSMAEAVAAYTGKKYGTKMNKKRKLAELNDSDEEEEEETPKDNLEDLGEEEFEDEGSENENFQSANEYQSSSSSSDADYSAEKSEKSESESLSEEPEDLQTLKADLKRDEAEFSPKLTTTSSFIEPEQTTSEQTPEQESDQNKAKDEPQEPQPDLTEDQDLEVDSDNDIDIEKYYRLNEQPTSRSERSQRINKYWNRKLLDKKPLGLLNQGVTCYMNTAIQSIIHIPAMTNYLLDVYQGKYNHTLPPRSVTHVLAELTNRLWNLDNGKKAYIHPKKIINRLEDINCMMSEWQQEDSHEYFMSLISRMQEDSTPKGVKLNKSIIYDIFGGLLNQTVICENCKNKSETKQEFYDLSLGFNKRNKKLKKFTIKRSIEDYFSSELIKIDKEKNGYYCEVCKKNNNAIKFSTIDRFPEILTIHLKRFKFNGSQSLKVKQLIKYSNYLDLSKFSTTHDTSVKYKLIAIISHEGRSILSGHYISHCLQPHQTWYTYDDEYINKINEFQALNDPSAYVLLYAKLSPKT